ncbi:hypothetical protein G7Y89_g11379 [Cudoniella acicularis]|uniref:NADH dehydrogenase [ubiquinone] 1 beta subcomplex subunit 7 n=1 Tax=Cudoniella acicularis TaxID=354080 RepID=A0A8H4RCF9_9HELO|nr:hypothetical protein G7Y89_g11379 [Cudoniella acicularis]
MPMMDSIKGAFQAMRGDVSDLDEAVRATRRALDLTPKRYSPERTRRLDDLESHLATRHSTAGAIFDLDEAIRYLMRRYRKTGAVTDAEGAAQALRKALNIDREKSVGGTGHLLRLGLLGISADLDEAVQITREVLTSTPADLRKEKGQTLENLGSHLAQRFSRTEALADLEDAISPTREALACSPHSHSRRAARLYKLGLYVYKRYSRTKSTADLDEAVRLAQEAVEITPPDDRKPAALLQTLMHIFDERDLVNLGSALSRTGILSDLDATIEVTVQALEQISEHHPQRASWLCSLASYFVFKWGSTDDLSELDHAISYFQSALLSSNSPIGSRVRTGEQIVWISGLKSDWEAAYEAATTALRLVPNLAPRSLANADKQHVLSRIVGLASDAAAVALHAGKGPRVALDLLEQGRGVLAASIEDLHTDVGDLQEKHPSLAEEFVRLRDDLARPATRYENDLDLRISYKRRPRANNGLLQNWPNRFWMSLASRSVRSMTICLIFGGFPPAQWPGFHSMQQDAIATALPKRIFHFAGHGHTDDTDPSQSYPLLNDWKQGRLTVAAFLEVNLRQRLPFLAYLSACGTGFRHIVGTLWEVNDESCVEIARTTYEEMKDGAMTDKSVRHRNGSGGKGEPSLLETGTNINDMSSRGERDERLPRDVIACDDSDDDDESTGSLSWVSYIHFGVFKWSNDHDYPLESQIDIGKRIHAVLEDREPPSRHPSPRLSLRTTSIAYHDRHRSCQIGPATREAMSEARLPLAYRDTCANLLIPLNRCRYEEYYLPWKCETERHSYEKCQYVEFKKRVAKMDELRAAKGSILVTAANVRNPATALGLQKVIASVLVTHHYEMPLIDLNSDPVLPNISVLSLDLGGMGDAKFTKCSSAASRFLWSNIMPSIQQTSVYFWPNGALRTNDKSAGDCFRVCFDEELDEYLNALFLNGGEKAGSSRESGDGEAQRRLWVGYLMLVG